MAFRGLYEHSLDSKDRLTVPSRFRAALSDGNRAYEEKFGHVFIVCAAGKTAAEMLAVLRERLKNDPDTELRAAAAEHRRITTLRLEKLLG